MRRPPSSRSDARTFVVVAAAIVVAACAPPGPLTQHSATPTEVPPTALPEPSAVPPPPTRPETARQAPAGAACREVDEDFQGHYRADAKTRYVMARGTFAAPDYFPDLGALREFLRPQIDQLMRHRYPHLGQGGTRSGHRVSEEQHNVTVDAYIHAVKHEAGRHGDRDFHVMLGSSPTTGDGIFMTAEASGLPGDGTDRPLLAAARRQLLDILGTCRWGNGFLRVSPPIRVRVTGSLFFDGDHAIGSVGPQYAKPFTVWEIHPVLALERLENAASADGASLSTPSGESPPSATDEAADRPGTPPAAPDGHRMPTARCRDGTLSYAKSHGGACSRHGGVAEWLQ